MKDSGISWVGEIPKEWSVNRAKYCFANTKEIAGCRSDRYERLALTMNGVIKRSKDDSNGLQPEKFETYQILRPDELVFKLIDLQNVSTSRVGLSPYLGLVSPAYIILKSNKRVLPAFAEKYFLMLWKNQIFNALGDAGVRSNLNSKDLLELSIPFPSLDEQQRIAEFLDRECGKIDGLKADIQSQIDTLEQYKRSVITEAVTHGLNPSAPMKDSGIPWVDEVSQNWDIRRVKYIATCLKKGNGITKEDIVEGGDTLCIRYGEIYTKYNLSFFECTTRTNKERISSKQYFTQGDILFAGTGELIEEIGKNIVYLGTGDCLAGGDIIILKHKQNARYLNYALNSECVQAQKSCNKAKLKVVHISAFEIGNIKIALPPLDEQQEIADYLDNKCAEIEQIIADKKSQIETLDGYKKSLIYEYVTGKKEVV